MITEITEADLPPQFRAESFYLNDDLPKMIERFKAYCRDNRILYYARPREDFSLHEAYRMAGIAGCDKLLLEDLS